MASTATASTTTTNCPVVGSTVVVRRGDLTWVGTLTWVGPRGCCVTGGPVPEYFGWTAGTTVTALGGAL